MRRVIGWLCQGILVLILITLGIVILAAFGFMIYDIYQDPLLFTAFGIIPACVGIIWLLIKGAEWGLEK